MKIIEANGNRCNHCGTREDVAGIEIGGKVVYLCATCRNDLAYLLNWTPNSMDRRMELLFMHVLEQHFGGKEILFDPEIGQKCVDTKKHLRFETLPNGVGRIRYWDFEFDANKANKN